MREYKEMYMYEQYKALTSLQKENSRGKQGAWKDRAQTVCWGSTLQLRHSDQQPVLYKFQALTCFTLQDLDMRIQGSQIELPRRVVIRMPSGEHR